MGAAATKCLVCGADLTLSTTRPTPAVRPAGGFQLPGWALWAGFAGALVIGLLITLYAVGMLQTPPDFVPATATATPSSTAPPTFTYTPTPTETSEPTATPLPPVDYQVVTGDTCSKIAAKFNVSVQSIILLNGLDPNCVLSIGVTLKIPQPTPTATPLPTSTLGVVGTPEPTRATYTVHSGDTLQGIATFFRIPLSSLMEANGITDPSKIREGQVLIIPLEDVVPDGPTPTPSQPPPWPAPNLLQPADGQIFTAGDFSIALQWAGVGELRGNEFYYVTIEDVTCNCASFYRQATIETKLILPESIRPPEGTVRAYRWSVLVVRQRPTTSGQPEYDAAGATSASRIFVWMGGAPTAAP